MRSVSAGRSVAFLSVLLFNAPTWVLAEQPFVEVSSTQLEYNTQAVEALSVGDSAKAILLMRSALALGEANVLYLNLGRALAQAGQCSQALGVYQQALAAPKLSSPTPDEVAKIIERYRNEVESGCLASLQLQCSSSEVFVRLDDGEAFPCPLEALRVDPGPHLLHGEYRGQGSSQQIDLARGQNLLVQLHFDAPLAEDGLSALGITGLALGGAGAAALLSSLLLDLAVLGPAFDELETAGRSGDLVAYRDRKDEIDGLQPINQALLVGGGVLLVGGGVLLLLDLLANDTDSSGASALWLSPDGAGCTWSFTW